MYNLIPWYKRMIMFFIPAKKCYEDGYLLVYKDFMGHRYFIDFEEVEGI